MRKINFVKGARKMMMVGTIVMMAVGMTACGTGKADHGAGASGSDGNGAGGNESATTATVRAESKFNNDFASSGIMDYNHILTSVCKGQGVSTAKDDNFFYTIFSNDTVEVYYIGGLGETVTYPCEYDGKPVRAIGVSYQMNNGADRKPEYQEFADQEKVKNVVIPETVWCIDTYAFKNFKNMTSINIPEGIVYFGPNCFEDCDGLTEVTLPKSTLYVAAHLFLSCDKLQTAYAYNRDTININDTFYYDNCPAHEFTFKE